MAKYSIGCVEASARSELGMKAVNHCGLGLDDTTYVGRKLTFNNPEYPAYEGVHVVVGSQMAYGYNEQGVYALIPALRVVPVNKPDAFGCPACFSEITFVD